jgi:hypothetical protein
MKTSKALRTAIERHRDSGESLRYPLRLRDAVTEFTKRQRSASVSYETLAEELGLSLNTLRRWCERSHQGRLTNVEVTGDAPSVLPVLVMRSGHRVEGLSITALCELLGRLS